MQNADAARKAYEEAAALFERSHEQKEAEATRQEAQQRTRGLPWWAIAALILFVLLCLIVILVIVKG